MGNKSMVLYIILLISPMSVGAVNIIPFVSPDNSFSHLYSFLEDADSVYISGYTFTDPNIIGVLRGKKATILLENGPVGGMPSGSGAILCNLASNGADIYLYTGKLKFLHAKYIVKDNSSALVSSENFGESGYPLDKGGNRGWGAIVEDKNISTELLRLLFTDLKTSKKFMCNLDDYRVNTGAIVVDYRPQIYDGDVSLLVAPGAVEPLLDLIESANESIYLGQFYIYKKWGSRPNLLLEKVIEKARDGLEVKILLDSSYYNIDRKDPNSNYYTVEYVNNISQQEGLDLEAKLIDLDKLGYIKMHTKGMIIDNNTVLVSSINWNENSPRNNREVGLIVSGNVAGHYTDFFFRDWNGVNIPRVELTGKLVDYAHNLISVFVFIVVTSVGFYVVSRYRKSRISGNQIRNF